MRDHFIPQPGRCDLVYIRKMVGGGVHVQCSVPKESSEQFFGPFHHFIYCEIMSILVLILQDPHCPRFLFYIVNLKVQLGLTGVQTGCLLKGILVLFDDVVTNQMYVLN